MEKYYLGFDAGTQSVKAAVYDSNMQCGRGNQRILFHIPEKMLGSCIFVYCTGACDNPASSSGHKNQPEDHGGRKLLYGT